MHASTTSVVIGGLSPASLYTFTVTARDPQGNVSMASNPVSISTLPLPNGLEIANPAGVYSQTSLTYSADFYLGFGFEHVFIDSDNQLSTGWKTGSTPPLGADYMIENNFLYKYAGTGTDFTWTYIDTMPPAFNGYNITWTVPASDITNPGPVQSVVFSGNGYAPTAYANAITCSSGPCVAH
jgi:hypothetical protein